MTWTVISRPSSYAPPPRLFRAVDCSFDEGEEDCLLLDVNSSACHTALADPVHVALIGRQQLISVRPYNAVLQDHAPKV